MREEIQIGFQVFVSDGGEEVGAVREVAPGGRAEIVIWVENGGDFTVPMDAVQAVHSQKVILASDRLDPQLQAAISHAHDAEQPDL